METLEAAGRFEIVVAGLLLGRPGGDAHAL